VEVQAMLGEALLGQGNGCALPVEVMLDVFLESIAENTTGVSVLGPPLSTATEGEGIVDDLHEGGTMVFGSFP
jgi:hypothetical protein